jgi:uncharacterized membrane protein (DUF373 family)
LRALSHSSGPVSGGEMMHVIGSISFWSLCLSLFCFLSLPLSLSLFLSLSLSLFLCLNALFQILVLLSQS